MEFKIKTGLSLKFDDEKMLDWAYARGLVLVWFVCVMVLLLLSILKIKF